MKIYNVTTTDGTLTINANSKKEARQRVELILRNEKTGEKIESISLKK